MTKQEIDNKYQELSKTLDAEFFDFLPDRRRLKVGQNIGDFDSQQAALWQAHEAELIAAGYMQPRPVPPAPVDWGALLASADTLPKLKAFLAKRLGLEKLEKGNSNA